MKKGEASVLIYSRPMTEADFQTKFGRWIVSEAGAEAVGYSAAYELKIVKLKPDGSSTKKREELKCCGGVHEVKKKCRASVAVPALSFSAVKEHQVEALRRAKGTNPLGSARIVVRGFVGQRGKEGTASGKGSPSPSQSVGQALGALYHKISDMAFGFKPCDCVVVRNGGGFLVVQYWKPGVGHFYMIDVEAWERLMASKGGVGSMSEEEAGEIGRKFEFEKSQREGRDSSGNG